MPDSQPRLLVALAEASDRYRFDRKFLLCSSPAEGREILHALARSGTAWTGWEAISLRQLAHELAGPAMAETGATLADEFDVLALIDESIDAVSGRVGDFGRAIGAPGFRDAAQQAIQALRNAGATPTHLLDGGGPDTKLALLAEVLREFDARLAATGRVDGAGLFQRAISALDSGTAHLPDVPIFVVAGVHQDGWAGRFSQQILSSARAEVLPCDPVRGLDAPTSIAWLDSGSEPAAFLSYLHAPDQVPEGTLASKLDLFAAATPVDELREVLRRVLERNLPWDQVEIITTDPFTYGPALDTLARRLGVPVTHAAGLPSERTRAGRAVRAYVQWISEGFPSDRLRRLLEAGDVVPPADAEASGAALAKRLRRLRIGWGRDRYIEAIGRARRALETAPVVGGDQDTEDAAWARERERQELDALHAMLTAILSAAPPAPERLGRTTIRTSAGAVAAGMLAFMEYVPGGDEVENTTRLVIRRRLQRARQTLTRDTSFEAAVSMLQSRLGLRVAAHEEGGSAAWTSQGGRIHLSDLANGGFCHRAHTFVVGLDATRTTAARGGDPLLSDGERSRLNAIIGGAVPALATTGDRIAQARHAVAATLARLRGEVTLSYSAWDASEGRAVSPSAELLQALRLRERNPYLTYDDLRKALGPLACAVPHGETCLDGSDVWMRTLAAGRELREGRSLVRDTFQGLDHGLRAQDLRQGDALTPHQGRISREVAAELLREMVFSPSRLEMLGACPRKFLYRYLLRVRPTEDPEWDSDAWLDALERGTLLHAVYEHTLGLARDRAIGFDDSALEALAMELLEQEARKARHRVPPPSERVFELEMDQLRVDVQLFVAMVRELKPNWLELEYEFGTAERPVVVELGGRELRLQGKIDRVDQTAPGTLRVIDYKTGSARRYRRNQPFSGGRRIQHVVYLKAAEQLLGGTPEAMEYHFPTTRGENSAVSYPKDALAEGETVLRALLDLAFAGLFVATEDVNDCKYCDYRPICRAREDDWGNLKCDETAWSKKKGMEMPEYEPLQIVRGIDG